MEAVKSNIRRLIANCQDRELDIVMKNLAADIGRNEAREVYTEVYGELYDDLIEEGYEHIEIEENFAPEFYLYPDERRSVPNAICTETGNVPF